MTVLVYQLLVLYFKPENHKGQGDSDQDEECMLLLFKGVLCYVTQLSLAEVEEQLLVLPGSMPPEQIRALLANTIWSAQDLASQHEALFAKQFSYRAKLPCGSMLAAAMGTVVRCSLSKELPGVSRADAAGHSFTAQWIFSIDPAAGTLRTRVESEGFLLVERASGTYLLENAPACPETMPECAGGTEYEGHPGKRRRYFHRDPLPLAPALALPLISPQ